jgi:hypothetical protein
MTRRKKQVQKIEPDPAARTPFRGLYSGHQDHVSEPMRRIHDELIALKYTKEHLRTCFINESVSMNELVTELVCSPTLVQRLSEMLSDKNEEPKARYRAAGLLGLSATLGIDTRKAVPAVIDALAETDLNILEDAVRAVCFMGVAGYDIRKAKSDLKRLSSHECENISEPAKEALKFAK